MSPFPMFSAPTPSNTVLESICDITANETLLGKFALLILLLHLLMVSEWLQPNEFQLPT